MRNYVFISNKGAQELIDEHLVQYSIPTKMMEVEKNAKGKVLRFFDSYWAERLSDYVQDQRNLIAHDLMVLCLTPDEKRRARETVRSLTRINDELFLIIKQFRQKEVQSVNP